MLVLSRKIGEKIVLDGNITVTVVDIKRNQIRLAFDAPNDVTILRAELVDPVLKDKPAEWQASEQTLALAY